MLYFLNILLWLIWILMQLFLLIFNDIVWSLSFVFKVDAINNCIIFIVFEILYIFTLFPFFVITLDLLELYQLYWITLDMIIYLALPYIFIFCFLQCLSYPRVLCFLWLIILSILYYIIVNLFKLLTMFNISMFISCFNNFMWLFCFKVSFEFS